MAAAVTTSTNVSLRLLPKLLLSSISRLHFSCRPLAQPSHALRLLTPPSAAGSSLTLIRFWANGSGEWRPTEMAPLFRGIDYEHWVVLMDKPQCSTRWSIARSYVRTLAKVVESEEDAFCRIYKVASNGYFGFGCKIDEETSDKLKGLPGVLAVVPDPEFNYCGEEKEGKISQMREKIKQLLADAERLKKVTARHSARHYPNAQSFWTFSV